MSPYQHKTLPLAIPVIYSLFLHAAAIGFVLTAPLFKGEVHIEPYMVTLEMGPTESEAPSPERLAGKKDRAMRMASVKALKKKEEVRSAVTVQKENRVEVIKEKPHWPAKPEVQKKSPPKQVRVPTVARRSMPAAKKPVPESVEKVQGPALETQKSKEIPGESTRGTKEAAPPPPEPERDPYDPQEVSGEEIILKPGWQDLPREVKVTEEKKRQEVPPKEGKLDETSLQKEAEVAQEEKSVGGKEAVLVAPEDRPSEEALSEKIADSGSLSKSRAEDDDTASERLGKELCQDCDLISMLHENPAEEIMLEAPEEAGDSQEAEIRDEEINGYSPVDGLCEGCSLMSILQANPIEEILYSLMNEGQTVSVADIEPEVAGPDIEQLCPGCDILAMVIDNLTGGFLPRPQQFERAFAGASEVIIKAPIVLEVARAEQSEVGEPIVIEVPKEMLEAAELRQAESQEEYMSIRDSDALVSQVAEILTPSDNSMPNQAEYLDSLEMAAAELPQKSEVIVASEAEIGLPIYVRRDIEIKVYFSGKDESVSFRFVNKSHPMESENPAETDITEALEAIVLAGDEGLRRIFSLAKAGKGTYIFIMESSSENVEKIDVNFLLHKGLKSEKTRDYSGIEVAPGSRIELKFLMPEAVFWDDEDYFSGTIESSSFKTKFNGDTGLIWKERNTR